VQHWRHLRWICLDVSVVVGVRSLDPPPTSSSSSLGRQTFLRLRRHHRQVARPSSLWLRHRSLQVARPPFSSIVVGFRLLYFLRLRHRRLLRQVARPPSGYVVVIVRSLDLPSAPSSSSSGRSTSLRLCHCLRQVDRLPPVSSSSSSGRQRPPSGSVVAFVKDQDLPQTSLSFASGRSTFLRLRRRLRKLGRPPQNFTSGMKASLWGAC
jgi:hypothetical protein